MFGSQELAVGQGPSCVAVASYHTESGTLLVPLAYGTIPQEALPPLLHNIICTIALLLVVCCTMCLHKRLLAALVVLSQVIGDRILVNAK